MVTLPCGSQQGTWERDEIKWERRTKGAALVTLYRNLTGGKEALAERVLSEQQEGPLIIWGIFSL